ncbi:high-affinity lysophosphatidic acid receptor [Ictalurus punctatus]|uniref:High-affinity lysophosphatidic acid receptor n=1 Tax=Ictalurus punctatus TaxID=7998 RepID=W5UDW8_ICTPU|nr:high-affinity lysophosphatidic acid receptor [Ictalurus punctatus]XP_017325879.1 high-affinity lysophosphatidic acid receptor [Ictalurus punctatus]XP_047011807.1 high-affinity lysophosphatidic acid receptor [Ictalurus punctatus]
MSVCNASSLEQCGLLGPAEPELQKVEISLIPVVIRVALAAIMIFMITIGFLGNSVVCLIVYQKPAMRSAINLLLATLAFSDIMLSLLCMPFTAVTVASTDWSFGVGFCRASVMLYWFFVLEGVSILLIISVDRFLIIVQRQDKLTPHRAKVLIAASWALSFCVALPSVVNWRAGIIVERVPQCILGYSDSLAERGYMVLLAVAVFFVPFSVMLYSYMCILNTVRRNALRIHTHVAEDCAGLKLGLTGLQRPPQVNVDMSFKTRAFTTILILFIGFSVCWLPHTVVSLLAVFSRRFYFSPAFYPVSIGALWLSYLKAVFNPVIYCWRIRKFREACLDFMPKTCRLYPKVPGRSHRRIRPSNIYICSTETQSAV